MMVFPGPWLRSLTSAMYCALSSIFFTLSFSCLHYCQGSKGSTIADAQAPLPNSCLLERSRCWFSILRCGVVDFLAKVQQKAVSPFKLLCSYWKQLSSASHRQQSFKAKKQSLFICYKSSEGHPGSEINRSLQLKSLSKKGGEYMRFPVVFVAEFRR